jgi:hypothetical protein
MQVDGPKAADRNGSQQTIRPSEWMLAGLRILCSSRALVRINRFAPGVWITG